MQNIYYLGLDIGTDSVGYAVTGPDYKLKRFHGEPMWGATLFDAASGAAERRSFRTARRRLDRRQQRVALLRELFVPAICAIDPNFFIRRRESALFPEDTTHGVRLFDGGELTDSVYHKRYPTIHHLIFDLMTSNEPHDIRLVYMACAWLVSHRGHFLLDIPTDNIAEILNFGTVYQDFLSYIQDAEYELPWNTEISPEQIRDILKKEIGISRKNAELRQLLFPMEKPSKERSETFPCVPDLFVQFLAGKKLAPKDLFANPEYDAVDSLSLGMDDEEFIRITAELGEDGELLAKLRAMSNCAQLIAAMNGASCISEGKIRVYEQHKADLRKLKRFVKCYCPNQYNEIFRDAAANNYVSYSHNAKSAVNQAPDTLGKLKFSNKEEFCDFLKKKLKDLTVAEADQAGYDSILQRLDARTFLPKQTDGDNRVIPQQLYRHELSVLLAKARQYTPLLTETDADGLTVEQKILSIFDFRVPYFVGPMKGANSWMVRKAEGKIFPWNFTEKVNLDSSEQQFISRMTNTCTYLPGEEVLPEASLLYDRYTVLNEINNIQVNGQKLPVSVKQALYTEVFEQKQRVTVKDIRNFLLRRGCMERDSELSGLDETVKAGLKSHHIFRRLLNTGVLTMQDAEDIIRHAAYSEDKPRMRRWLKATYPQLDKTDMEYLLRQNFNGFGRLSARLLTGIYGTEQDSDGEAFSILDMLWNTNENLMQLLSGKYTFNDTIQEINREYYQSKPKTLDERLADLYVPNAVKRPIHRTLAIVSEVSKAMGCAPTKIFVEMARGGTEAQKGQRTSSRRQQLLNLYRQVTDEDSVQLAKELEKMENADNRLQSKKLYLYYLQMGKSAYTGKPIALSSLTGDTYNIDHIYPQCHVKDDSLLNNLVLVESTENGRKSDTYPLPAEIREKQHALWQSLKNVGLMTEEKYHRLTRFTPFTEEEQLGFINRQLVETRQSTKVIKNLLAERFPDTQIVCVKAGIVSEFRQAFSLPKCRVVNDLHHAKDAYLNIVVGNVYDLRFTRRWFSINSHYNVQVEKIFTQEQHHGDMVYWRGEKDQELVQKTMEKNTVHLTRYTFCRRGGLFDQQPVKKSDSNLIPLKNGLPTEKYGGYNKPTASFFVLARYMVKKKPEVMLVPINLLDADRFRQDAAFAQQKTADMIAIVTGKQPEQVTLPLGERILKINTVISLDGMRMTLSGKSSGGRQLIFSPLMPLLPGSESERYIKAMDSFRNKQKENPSLVWDKIHDTLSPEENLQLYDRLVEKLQNRPYSYLPNNPVIILQDSSTREKFITLSVADQCSCLLGILALLNGKANNCNLSALGGSKTAGAILLSSSLSNWKKKYRDVRIVDCSAAGLSERYSKNLLDLL